MLQFPTEIKKIIKDSHSHSKECFFIGCKGKIIKAHSISKGRILKNISKDSKVVSLDPERILMKEHPISTASTFRGFCDKHDKIFNPIDTSNYIEGDKHQEFLFALRALSIEIIQKKRYDYSMSNTYFLQNINNHPFHQRGLELAHEEQMTWRKIFIDCYNNKKFKNIIRTTTFKIPKFYPIAACGSVNLEKNLQGHIINDPLPSGFESSMKPLFINVFPQDEGTFVIFSYFNRDKKSYSFLNDIKQMSIENQKKILSNIIVGNLENIFIKPGYLEDNNILEDFIELFLSPITTPYIEIIQKKDFNIFQ